MKVAVIGATGTIGKAVAHELEARGHEVVRASRNSEHRVDIEDIESIRSFYAEHPDLEAVVSATGRGSFGKVDELDDAGYELALKSKLMGQVNLVREGAKQDRARTFVLTTGVLAVKPWPKTAALAMVNAGLEGFARAAALDLPERRILIASPPLIRESAVAMGMGEIGAPAALAAKTYADLLESGDSGTVHFVPGHDPLAS